VANKFLNKTDLRYRDAYIELFEHLHSSAKLWSDRLKTELNRYFYVTPTSYIEFIITFKQLLADKRKENKQLIYKYENGYSKIVSTEDVVEKMKKTL
jgi:dynein heavy chain